MKYLDEDSVRLPVEVRDSNLTVSAVPLVP